MLRIAVFCLLLAIALPTHAQQDGWKTVRDADGSFSVDFPEAPKLTTDKLTSKANTPYLAHNYTLDYGSAYFTATTTVFPADTDTSRPESNLQGGLNARARQLKSGWTRVDWIQVDGAPATDATGITMDGLSSFRELSVFKGKRVVRITWKGQLGLDTSPAAERFMKSLKIY